MLKHLELKDIDQMGGMSLIRGSHTLFPVTQLSGPKKIKTGVNFNIMTTLP